MTNIWLGWAAIHPEHGFEEGMGADGGGMLRVYDDLDKELIDTVNNLNQDDPEKRWKAVKVKVIEEGWDRNSKWTGRE